MESERDKNRDENIIMVKLIIQEKEAVSKTAKSSIFW
jgi:hypothetical protein